MFLHGGLLHLVLNAWGLYQLGALFELLLGSPAAARWSISLAGVAGSLASVHVDPRAQPWAPRERSSGSWGR